MSEQINALAVAAREAGDLTSEQFMQWFIKEQVEEVATMSDLLRVVQRSEHDPMAIEDYLVREQPAGADRRGVQPAQDAALTVAREDRGQALQGERRVELAGHAGRRDVKARRAGLRDAEADAGRIPLWLRRLVTMAPAFVVVALGIDATRALILSQVLTLYTTPVVYLYLDRLQRWLAPSRRASLPTLAQKMGATGD